LKNIVSYGYGLLKKVKVNGLWSFLHGRERGVGLAEAQGRLCAYGEL
jgi:hypothetical protein